MQKFGIKVFLLIILGHLLIGGFFLAVAVNATPISIKADYGSSPDIDGIIDMGNNEWENAVKNSFYLYPNLTNPQNGLPIELWTLQTADNLFLSIQFQLENHNSEEFTNEFVGLVIANNEQSNFIDAKFVRFNNLSDGDFNFTDYYIENDIFLIDTIQNGNGAAHLDQNNIIYEFSLPIRKNATDVEDVYLNYGTGSQRLYKIVFGTKEISYNNFLIQNEVSIELQFPPLNPPLSITEILLLTFNIIIFGSIGCLYSFYIYRITQLKKEIKRIKS
ncbi:MAG: hypothetical protein ACFFKA_09635 [Candidatus Thorarchaeota archaeon]